MIARVLWLTLKIKISLENYKNEQILVCVTMRNRTALYLTHSISRLLLFTLSEIATLRSTPPSFLPRAICAGCERPWDAACIGCSQRGGSFDKFYGIEERTIFCPNSVRTHRVGVFSTTVSSYCSTFVPARDRWIAVIQPGDTATGYSLVHVPTPDPFPFPTPRTLANRDLGLYGSKSYTSSALSLLTVQKLSTYWQIIKCFVDIFNSIL